MQQEHYPFVNQPLPYAYDALEPYIDTKTMMLHHDKHLQTYINNLNKVLENKPLLQRLSLEELIQTIPHLPPEIQTQVRNNAGGVYNHRFYFDNLKNPSQGKPEGLSSIAIDKTFGSFEQFQKALKEAALSVFGSGYGWLVCNDGKLEIITTPNQNTPLEQGLCPLLNVDVWEHAYYLKHYNLRADYIDDLFQIINWQQVDENYQKCLL